MSKETTNLSFGPDLEKFSVSKKGTIKSCSPQFIINLRQLEILLLKSNGFEEREIASIIMFSTSTVGNLIYNLYKENREKHGSIQNDRSKPHRGDYIKVFNIANQLGLVNIMALRGIMTVIGDRYRDKEEIIFEAIEKAINNKNKGQWKFGIYPKKLHKTYQYNPISITLQPRPLPWVTV